MRYNACFLIRVDGAVQPRTVENVSASGMSLELIDVSEGPGHLVSATITPTDEETRREAD